MKIKALNFITTILLTGLLTLSLPIGGATYDKFYFKIINNTGKKIYVTAEQPHCAVVENSSSNIGRPIAIDTQPLSFAIQPICGANEHKYLRFTVLDSNKIPLGGQVGIDLVPTNPMTPDRANDACYFLKFEPTPTFTNVVVARITGTLPCL